MRSQTASITLAAANAAGIAASQTPGGAGALTLTASPVVLDAARRVIVTTTGSDAGKTLTVLGTDRNGGLIREVLTLVNTGVTQSGQDFKTVTSAVISAAASALTVGTNGVASTRWIGVDNTVSPFSLGTAITLGGVTANVTVEVTFDEINRAYTDSLPQGGSGDLSTTAGSAWVQPIAFPILSAATADAIVGYGIPVRALRLTVNSGATTAGVRVTVIQAGNV